MTSLRGASALVVAAAAVALGVAGAHAGPQARRWTQITHAHSGAKANLGLARGKDGTLHVLWAGRSRAPFTSILDTPISPVGKVGRSQAVLAGWTSVQPPAAAAGRDGSIHVLVSGQKVDSNTDPFSGLNEAVGPGSWKLGPRAFGKFQLTVSSAADVSTAMLPGGELVSAWRSATTMLFQRGVDSSVQPQVITPANDLVELPAIAADEKTREVVVAFDSVKTRSVYFRRVLPSLDAPKAMPGAKNAGPSLAARIGGGIYTAYSPDGKKVWLLRFGAHTRSVPVPKGVQVLSAGLAAGPEGRLWVFYGNTQQTFVTRTSKSVAGFEPVQAFASPKGALQYFRLEGEGSAGPLDLFADVTVNGGSKDGSYHTHVLPQLSLAVAKKALPGKQGTRVTVRVLDAGDPITGATVTGLPGGAKRTGATGAVVVTVAGKSAAVTASKPGYLSAKGEV